jgi:hypothetical protein
MISTFLSAEDAVSGSGWAEAAFAQADAGRCTGMVGGRPGVRVGGRGAGGT